MVLAAQDGPLPPWPQLRPGSLPLACAALLLQVPPWVGASGWLPHGRGRHVALRSLIGALQERHPEAARSLGRRPHLDRGDGLRHRAAGAVRPPGAPPASLADAVVASCSIPGWYEPARIGGRRYVDGGVCSATSLSVLAGTDVQEVYVLAPMASTEPDHPLQPHLRLERRVRQLFTGVLLRQAKALGAQGKRVTVVTPGPRDLAVMGANLMDPGAGRPCWRLPWSARPAWTYRPRSPSSLCRSARGLSAGTATVVAGGRPPGSPGTLPRAVLGTVRLVRKIQPEAIPPISPPRWPIQLTPGVPGIATVRM